jgi:hypothetical protein
MARVCNPKAQSLTCVSHLDLVSITREVIIMKTQQHFPQLQNTRQCSNAKPPINQTAKHEQGVAIGDDVTAFLAKGGVIEPVANYGRTAKVMTYKEKNRSTYVKEDV